MKPWTSILVAGLSLATLSGCATTVAMQPAPDAGNPECAEVTVRLPDTIDDLEQRPTDAQATGAWGDPVAVFLRCGVEVPGPSALMCVSLEGIDWLRDDTQAPRYVFTTYGRDPAVEVVVDGDVASGTNALLAVRPAVSKIEQDRFCTNPDEVLQLPTPPPDN